MAKKIGILTLLSLILLLSGCVNQKEMETLNLQLTEKQSQLTTLQSQKDSLNTEVETLKSDTLLLKNAQIKLEEQLKSSQEEKSQFEEKITVLEGELKIQNEAALLDIQAKQAYFDRISALKATQSLKSLVSAYKEPLAGKVAEHYGGCLLEATKREGVNVLISLLESGNFDFVDGVIGQFATALSKTSDLNYKTQLMVSASTLDGSQTPTTLYFYARVLYFLSRS